jgi:hypothetical protein
VTRLDGGYVRPHDLQIHPESGDPGWREAVVDRVTLLGFEVHVELHLLDGQHVWSQITRNELARHPLWSGQHVFVEAIDAQHFLNETSAASMGTN